MKNITTLLIFAILAAILFTGCSTKDNQDSAKQEPKSMKSYKVEADFAPDGDRTKELWQTALTSETIINDWQGKIAYPNLKTEVKSLWSDNYLYLLYEAKFEDLALDPSIKPDEHGDCYGIWTMEVVEIFIGDNPDIKKYYEFVVSPVPQKIDIKHNKNLLPEEGGMDTAWSSGWEIGIKVDLAAKIWIAELRIPIKSIAIEEIQPGKKFRFNMFRCVGEGDGDGRVYMSFNATETEKPNYHVPEKFVQLELVGN